MSTSNELVFYDLIKRDEPACWSPNPWKTRLVLNYKAIPYTTTWLEYPDIAPTQQALGIAPNTDGGMLHTIPAVRLADGRAIQGSMAIATALERLHPSPSLHLDAPVLARVEALMPQIFGALAPVLLPRVPRDVLRPLSAEYFERTRAQRFGMSLAELEKSPRGGEAAWANVKSLLEQLAALLKENGDGVFFLGAEVSYADFLWVGLMRFCKVIGQDVFERIVTADASFGPLWEACQPWLKRDSY